MMKIRRLAFILLFLLPLSVTFLLVAPAQGSEEADNFVIIGADAVSNRSVDAFTTPIALDPRFILEAADKISISTIVAVPVQMPQLLDPRFILQAADRLAISEIQPIPEQMPRELEPRFIFVAVDKIRQIHMAYPCGLVGEPDAPNISNIQVTNLQASQATITWSTDEYTEGLVEYGLTPHSYLWSVYDAGYSGSHSVTLTGLAVATTYYYNVSSTDRCGNSATSTEDSFTTPSIYIVSLPLVLR